MSVPLARLLTNSTEKMEVFVKVVNFLKTVAERRVMYRAKI